MLRAVTRAPAIAAPLGSLTVPVTEPVTVCAPAAPPSTAIVTATANSAL